MTTTQTLTRIAILAAGAIGRDLVPVKSVTRSAAGKVKSAAGKVTPKPKAPAGPFLMYDAVQVANIPAGATAVLGYIDGHFATAAALRRRFPKAKHCFLTTGTNAKVNGIWADGIDYEKGDVNSPAVLLGWVKMMIGYRRYRPIIYASRSNMQLIWATLEQAGIKRNEVRLLVADWPAPGDPPVPHIPTGYDACQYENNAAAGYDVSLCNPGFLR